MDCQDEHDSLRAAEYRAPAGTPAVDEQLPMADPSAGQPPGRYAALGRDMRAKTWDELTADERIERLRGALRSKELAIRELERQLDALVNHRHGSNGELLVPYYLSPGYVSSRPFTYDPLA